MGKFLSGSSYSGARVPPCTYWSEDVTTDKTKDFAKMTSTGVLGGSCIANSFFDRDDISCFNSGNCNGEGKCIPCTKYKYGGMRLGISHSPPLALLKEFNRGITDEQLQSPNLLKISSTAAGRVSQDQLPLHILMRNIQAEIAKCCHWNFGDGVVGRFFLTTIKAGTTTREITDENGNKQNISGIVVTNSSFPDEVGSFFPVGTVVVAGFEDQPSFYLEPRTGLIKPGEGVIFNAEAGGNTIFRTKQVAVAATQPVIDAVNAAINARNSALTNLNTAVSILNNAIATGDPSTIATAQAKYNTAQADFSAADDASNAAQTLGSTANTQIGDVANVTTRSAVEAAGQALASTLDDLANEVEIAGNSAGGGSAASIAAEMAGVLGLLQRQLNFAAFGSFSKCEFFFETVNTAEQWNSPTDGSLPCNGVRTECAFYTGPIWQFATDEKMEVGKSVTAEQIQEVRFYSDDWARFVNPEEEFRTRFSVPFIWAFKGYIDVSGTPDVEDMLLYRPKVLLGRGTQNASFETIEVEKVKISDFNEFQVEKSKTRIQPGSDTVDKGAAPQFPSLISQLTVPSVARLRITHPRYDKDTQTETADSPTRFVYRSWSPDKNQLTLFGTGTPDAAVYLVNETALNKRGSYHTFLGTTDIVSGIPDNLPGSSSNFVDTSASDLLDIMAKLEREAEVSQSSAPLGFSKVTVTREGLWSSIQDVDLVHNEVNKIFAFLFVGESAFIFDFVEVDYRFLHSVVTQTSFDGVDFSIHDTTTGSRLGSNATDTVQTGQIVASHTQTVGVMREIVGFGQGYYGWRVKNRNLQAGILTPPSDLQGTSALGDSNDAFAVTESDASAFINQLTYQVVQYRKTVPITDWYLISDCGDIMLVIDDLNAHRVLPLPDTTGSVKALQNVLVNGGSTGSVVAQWALESVTLTVGEEQRNLVQLLRDSDGIGLPANYVLVGPDPALEAAQTAFGRPDPDTDTVEITFTFLRPQTSAPEGAAREAELEEELVTADFYGTNFRAYDHSVAFSEEGILTAGGARSTGEESGGEEEEEEEDSGTVGGNVAITDEQQEYVWVFTDSDGRPIGRKYTRMMLAYYNLSCVNVEIFYSWLSDCVVYGLIPDRLLGVGTSNGTLTVSLKGTIDPDELDLGHRVANLIGEKECIQVPSCGDHEFIAFGDLRREFETIVFSNEFPNGKAYYPSAGQVTPGGTSSIVEPPGSQFLRRRGPMWYPYTTCERPRYNFKTNGPLKTDSTELMNAELKSPGISGEFVSTGDITKNAGEYGGLILAENEAYRGTDRVVPKILDIHPSLRPCASAYTYGNQVLIGGDALFSGYARKRGEVDQFWYAGLQWAPGPFGNFGRSRLVFEVTEKRGDYLGGANGRQVAFRWMPLFPEREDLGASVGLFSEDMEPQHYRLTGTANPIGAIAETVDRSSRFTHKALIQNRTAAGIEYPFAPYFPSFVEDTSLGIEPEDRTASPDEGDSVGAITTFWAWREQEKAIGRGKGNSDILAGLQLIAPDYILDNRRLEVKLRPDEGIHTVTITAPKFNLDGSLSTNGSISLGNGPAREFTLDFLNHQFSVLSSADTVYDTSQDLGEGKFTCEAGTATDNLQLEQKCSCIQDITDEDFEENNLLPARFLHLDELAPAGFFALYASEDIETPFAIDIPREELDQPCCMCMYYIKGLFFKADPELLPTVKGVDPVFDSRVLVRYMWSRVPHGFASGSGQGGDDGFFDRQEVLGDTYIEAKLGEVLVRRFSDLTKSVNKSAGEVSAFFPSPQFATANQITLTSALSPGDPDLKGGVPADEDKNSRGEFEKIVMDVLFDTYVKVTKVTVGFAVGTGLATPSFILGVVDSRTGSPPTQRVSRVLAESSVTSRGSSFSFSGDTGISNSDLSDGEGLLRVTLSPSYQGVPFWSQFGQEFHLIFDNRDSEFSMGIAFVKFEVDAVLDGATSEERIEIFERKYYVSKGTANGSGNPEQFLGEIDSATVYWRTTGVGSDIGGNRFRAYAWGDKLEDDQSPIQNSEISALESLQKEEYDKSLSLMQSRSFTFSSFIPFDEADYLTFLGEGSPSWSLTLTSQVSNIDEVIDQGPQQPLYGVIPEREGFHAPGHAWTYDFDEEFLQCCIPCQPEMLIDFQYAHLHDGLAIVETASFWSELPSGFTRLIRSTMMSPDPTFQGGGVGQDVALLDAALFEGIDVETLENAGFAQSEDGGFVLLDNKGV